MTDAQRLRLAHIAQGRLSGPTAEDVRLLLAEVARLELALQAASQEAGVEAFRRLQRPRPPA